MKNSATQDFVHESVEPSKPKRRRKPQHQNQPVKLGPVERIAEVKDPRDQALDAAFGLFKGKDVLPDDALQFEREMRDEGSARY